MLIKIVGDTDGICYVNGVDYAAHLPDSYVKKLLNLLSGDSVSIPPVITCLVGDMGSFQIAPYEAIERNGNYIKIFLEKYTFLISTDGSGYIETRAN